MCSYAAKTGIRKQCVETGVLLDHQSRQYPKVLMQSHIWQVSQVDHDKMEE